jgi:hypothetical protein
MISSGTENKLSKNKRSEITLCESTKFAMITTENPQIAVIGNNLLQAAVAKYKLSKELEMRADDTTARASRNKTATIVINTLIIPIQWQSPKTVQQGSCRLVPKFS